MDHCQRFKTSISRTCSASTSPLAIDPHQLLFSSLIEPFPRPVSTTNTSPAFESNVSTTSCRFASGSNSAAFAVFPCILQRGEPVGVPADIQRAGFPKEPSATLITSRRFFPQQLKAIATSVKGLPRRQYGIDTSGSGPLASGRRI